MRRLISFLPVFYMAPMMTFSVSLINYLMGNTDNFWLFWGRCLMIGLPLALVYSRAIGPMMRFASKKWGMPNHK